MITLQEAEALLLRLFRERWVLSQNYKAATNYTELITLADSLAILGKEIDSQIDLVESLKPQVKLDEEGLPC